MSRRAVARVAAWGVVLQISIGAVSAAPTKRIFDGTRVGAPAAREEDTREELNVAAHDAVVALVNRRGFACSGVLVHPRGVLTARHCLGARRVVFGSDVEELRDQRSVVRSLVVPNQALDLALLVLDRDAAVEPYPVRYAERPPAKVRVVGFGCVDAECQDGGGQRTYLDAALRDGWGCGREVAGRLGCMPEHEMVLGASRGADTCTGDSGGAVLQRTEQGWSVLAVTSRSVADSVLPCGDGGIYVRLATSRSWLERELGKL